MLYKTLALVALLVQDANAGGALANQVDPRKLWFRWAIPKGGGDDVGHHQNDKGQNVRKCGVTVTPNTISKCYYTDCFDRLHGAAFGSRRRMGGAGIVHYDVAYGPKGLHDGCGDQLGRARRRMANAPHLAIQCKSNYCKTKPDVNQFRYWRKGAAAYEGLKKSAYNATYHGECPGGTQIGDKNDVTPEESWQWYGTPLKAGKNCIYGSPPNGCQCKTLVCRVSSKEETHMNTANWGPDGNADDQDADECNFIVRIEDVWPSPTVPKGWMWWIFTISATISLLLTGYYYVTYGTELVVEGKGSDAGSGN